MPPVDPTSSKSDIPTTEKPDDKKQKKKQEKYNVIDANERKTMVDLLARALYTSDVSPDFVANEYFIKFCHTLNPTFEVPSPEEIKMLIDSAEWRRVVDLETLQEKQKKKTKK